MNRLTDIQDSVEDVGWFFLGHATERNPYLRFVAHACAAVQRAAVDSNPNAVSKTSAEQSWSATNPNMMLKLNFVNHQFNSVRKIDIWKEQ